MNLAEELLKAADHDEAEGGFAYILLRSAAAHIGGLTGALSKLANEASGFLAHSDLDRHGMTNNRVLRLRIEEARDLIAKGRQL